MTFEGISWSCFSQWIMSIVHRAASDATMNRLFMIQSTGALRRSNCKLSTNPLWSPVRNQTPGFGKANKLGNGPNSWFVSDAGCVRVDFKSKWRFQGQDWIGEPQAACLVVPIDQAESVKLGRAMNPGRTGEQWGLSMSINLRLGQVSCTVITVASVNPRSVCFLLLDVQL